MIGSMKKELKLLLFSNYLNWVGFGLLTPIYAIFVLGIGGTAFDAASSWALYGILTSISVLLLGRLGDSSIDKRKLIVAGYLLTAAGALSLYFVDRLAYLYAALALNAIGVGILFPAWKAVYAKYSDKGFEAGEWALFDGGNYLFTGIAALAGGYLVTLYGFKTLFLAMFVVQLIAAAASLRLLGVGKKGK